MKRRKNVNKNCVKIVVKNCVSINNHYNPQQQQQEKAKKINFCRQITIYCDAIAN